MAAAWLVKQEPGAYPFEKLLAEKTTTWDGVRNAEARLALRAMKKGDRVLYYHSGDDKAVVGLARVSRGPFPDPTDPTGAWVAVELAAVRALKRPVTLAAMKADAAFAELPLAKKPRLSVMPVDARSLARVLELGG